jgi:hypothetical protein
VSSTTIVGAVVGSPGYRPCCVFTPDERKFTDASAVTHRSGTKSDEFGNIYTCSAGFIDVAHLRDLADLTKHYFDQLTPHKRAKGSRLDSLEYKGPGSNVEVVKDVPAGINVRLDVALTMAYFESVAHEVESYWYVDPSALFLKEGPGMHNSAFSPEDLVSNWFGALVGWRALKLVSQRKYPTFDDAAGDEVGRLLAAVGGIGGTEARTLEAFNKVEGTWFSPSFVHKMPWAAIFTLKRRNFGKAGDFREVEPWVLTGVTGCPTPLPSLPATLPLKVPAGAEDYWEATYHLPSLPKVADKFPEWKKKLGTSIKKSDLDAEIAEIKIDAKVRYGPLYDRP